MPITIPIEGGGEPPRIPIQSCARSAVEIRDVARDRAISGITVTGTSFSASRQSTEIAKTVPTAAISGINIVNGIRDRHVSAIEVLTGESFIILVDILQEALSGSMLGQFGQTEINAKLMVDGDELAIKSFSFQVPTGRLGSILNIVLADPNPTPVPVRATVMFYLVVHIDGDDVFHVLLNNGNLQERDYKITISGNKPGDEVTFGALDVLSDKFSLAPRRPVTMYDPRRVRIDDVRTDSENAIRDESGRTIMPVIEPVNGLTMKRILNRAYTNVGGYSGISLLSQLPSWNALMSNALNDQVGMGFTSVITNIPDYKVRRADFTIEGGWHDGALPVVAMYAPVYFVTGSILFIIDVDRPLPFAANPHTIWLSAHKSLSERAEYKPDANAVILTYQYSDNDPDEDPRRVSRVVFKTERQNPSGLNEGQPGFVEIETRTETIEWYFTDEPDVVLASYPSRINIITEMTIVWAIRDPDTSVVLDEVIQNRRVVHREETNYTYDGELETGHTREVFAAVTVSEEWATIPVLIEREACKIYWKDDPYNVGAKVQDRMTLEITGRCYLSNEDETIFDSSGELLIVRKIPALLAQASGFVESDMVLSDMVPIKTVRETLRFVKGQQVQR
jgi:hypothetical protein